VVVVVAEDALAEAAEPVPGWGAEDDSELRTVSLPVPDESLAASASVMRVSGGRAPRRGCKW
jgi:hypothetical protein